jgi:hypothetical protein
MPVRGTGEMGNISLPPCGDRPNHIRRIAKTAILIQINEPRRFVRDEGPRVIARISGTSHRKPEAEVVRNGQASPWKTNPMENAG